ncbi:non-hydrolyzing UDP-N-acetylglucosamine 2-epimerase [Azospirillum isscasi]|uniref:UDP-N-acetylglucosamine 2-epimerase (Non-hydrolyzing) n=1 Tax=Azospirillum isscasi TaxID=3053926 RepID=A0ABU0WM93_9PROT|nr:UDP-N-acetylglucosamine 2-epimerase (non-hydrolyzing) [Azospirillum isscasi]MDQ2105343.1 UDP-N-acetylglucosamine 2-epimerase (non-hydrolyzing) [Azospirillum isscasi]
MKLLTVVGARPQFIKAAAMTRVLRVAGDAFQNVMVHTGQHYDDSMSAVFFRELGIPEPDINLGIADLGHGAMTGRMLERLEECFMRVRPDRVLVYGDTNSTLAAALAAVKLAIPVGHVEAGLRSGNMRMPEEINRILTDRVSTWLFCPNGAAADTLRREGIVDGVHVVGDILYDVVLHERARVLKEVPLNRWEVENRRYLLASVHRQENTDSEPRLESILSALRVLARDMPVVLPLHPRTHRILEERNALSLLDGLRVTGPLSYLEVHRLMMSARAVLTDSGGMQKEAFYHRVPCLTLRDETEWSETLELGWNRLCGADHERILAAWAHIDSLPRIDGAQPYGDGEAAVRILDLLKAAP